MEQLKISNNVDHYIDIPECETWTKEEIDAFTKAMETSDKNFLLISRAVGCNVQ